MRSVLPQLCRSHCTVHTLALGGVSHLPIPLRNPLLNEGIHRYHVIRRGHIQLVLPPGLVTGTHTLQCVVGLLYEVFVGGTELTQGWECQWALGFQVSETDVSSKQGLQNK